MMKDETYLQEYITTRGLKPKTYNTLKSVLNHYTEYQQTTLHELIIEADQEEEQGIRWKHRTLKKRLTGYMNHLKNEMDINSAKTYFSMVKTFYHHQEIEIGKLPQWNKRNAIVNQPITYNDLPDREIIRNAVEMSTPLFRSIILFLCSTGMAKIDMRKITIQDFLNSTYEYHKTDDLKNAIEIMKNRNIIPTWKLRRSKTNKYFITFNTPEATSEIINYLTIRMEKQNIKKTDRLLPVNEHYFTKKFEEINDSLGLGKVGTYRRLRGHMLRKFHSSQLLKYGMDKYKINTLQGKSNGKVDDVYFFIDEKKLKKEYISAMEGLLIFTKTEQVTVDAPEVVEIKKQNIELKNQLDKFRRLQEEVDEIKTWFKS